jgi:hypothetical protein
MSSFEADSERLKKEKPLEPKSMHIGESLLGSTCYLAQTVVKV